jgi:hypothetical protein
VAAAARVLGAVAVAGGGRFRISYVCVVVAVPAYIPPVARLDTWTMWAYPLALSTAVLLAGVLARPVQVLAGSSAIAVVYVAVVAVPLAGDAAARATGVVNALAFPGFAMVAFLVAGFVRNLASAADAARERAAELEQDRSKALVHSLLPHLQLDRFAEADDAARVVMIAQAHAKHDQLRAFVDDAGGTVDLQERVNAALLLHPGLSIQPDIEVRPGVQVAQDALDQLERALDTALANVEQHAPARTLRSACDRQQIMSR